MKRELTCIICPRGCRITVEEKGEALEASGNSCPKGAEYAIRECTAPVRTVTAVARVSNRKNTMVSVKTAEPIAKGQMEALMELLQQQSFEAPISIGDVLLKDCMGTCILATRNVH